MLKQRIQDYFKNTPGGRALSDAGRAMAKLDKEMFGNPLFAGPVILFLALAGASGLGPLAVMSAIVAAPVTIANLFTGTGAFFDSLDLQQKQRDMAAKNAALSVPESPHASQFDRALETAFTAVRARETTERALTEISMGIKAKAPLPLK